MEITQGIVLPVLLAAIIANTVILVIVVIAVRSGRDHVTDTRSALEGGLMSTSFVDRSAQSEWTSNGRSDADANADVADDGTADAGNPAAEAATDEATADDGVEGDPDSTATDDTTGIDALTGLIDAAGFMRLVAAEDVRLQRYHRPATVVTFELGGLDRMIDRLGPDAADRVLPALADTMRRLARDVDYVARLAPGRFGVLLPETDEIAAINYVERVRRACELWLESGAIALTLAAGWAGSTGDPTMIEAMRLATDRMYVELRRDVRKTADY
jgi:diguanylate cyclase (GGDEF)-like protein